MSSVNWLNKLNKNLKYIVAVSGGSDSMFLLDNLVKNEFDIIVAHVNYKKRWSSDVDQEIIEDYCKRNKLKLEIKSVKAKEYTKGNFQSQARTIRYDFFNEIAKKYNVYNLIVAHHLDDLLETYLIQKKRKAIVSYYGLKFKSTYKELSVYRPMLEWKKQDINDYLLLNHVKYGFDETNELDIYERNKIRKQTISKLTDLDSNLMLNEIKELNSEQELIKDEWNIIYNTIVNKDDDILAIDEFVKYNNNNILQQMIVYEFLFNYDQNLVLNLKKSKIKEIVRILSRSAKPNIIFNFNENVWLIREYNFAYISERKELKEYKYVVRKLGDYEFDQLKIFKKKPKNIESQGLYVSKKDFPLTIKINSGQEEIAVNFGTKKINRFFIDKKIPYRERLTWPVILNSKKQVIAIPDLAISKNNIKTDKKPNMFIKKQ